MRFTSLIVELVRARPAVVFWIVTLLEAAIWFVVPLLLYASPPGEVANVLAFGREYVLGTDLGPPLAFWLADVAFRLAGNHMFGVYLLSQLCFVLAFWTLFRLGQLIVGPQHAALAVVLTATILAFGFPNLEFGPNVLAARLRSLESAGLLRKRRLPPPAASTVYELTELGAGLRPAVFALFLYGLLPILANTAAGLRGIR